MAGSLRQRGTESWELRVHAGMDDGSGRKRYVTHTVRGGRRGAERALARLVTEVEQGSASAHAGTVGELCNRWFDASKSSWSPTVVAEYRRLLNRHVLPRFGTLPLRPVRTADLDAWYGQLRTSGSATGGPLAPNSVLRVHAVLRRALGQGVRWGWIQVNGVGRQAAAGAAIDGHDPVAGDDCIAHRRGREGQPGATGVPSARRGDGGEAG